MTDIAIDTIINRTLHALENSDYSEFDLLLNQLSFLIKQSANNNNKPAPEERITQILDYTPNDFNQIKTLRLYRGLLILVRNFAPALDIDLFPKVVVSFEKFLKLHQTNEWTDKILEAYWQILTNFQRNEFIAIVNELFGQWECKYKWSNSLMAVMSPVIHFLFRQFNTQDPHITNENLLHLLKIFETNHVMNAVYEIFKMIDFTDTNNIGHDYKMFVHLLYDIITHESFQKWIEQQDEEETITKWLSLTSIVVQTKTDWNNYELIALLSWNGSLFMKYAPLLNSNKGNTTTNGEDNLNYVEDDLSTIISILAELSQFNATKQYFEHYQDLLPQLIFVFKWIHENIEPITIKNKQIEELGRYSSVKTNIITILSYLSYDSFQFQEKIRELGGLSLVLSNCIIDNNNPFIKEQAIVCLKYLLQKNPKNQQFVADLEAKKVVDDQVLSEVGYQVEVIDGKVEVKRKQ
ncbi:copper transport protein, putative [Candida dubliniensis CD36]|uniref:Ataxin-10 homolog n=1 Tax=Candida dubliniensis (strain CD36 / ATCC MYA-646 / CBS 7987 / NCPF 3949 / NRRL Y-17841) TaxID=573826 RepID=B9WHF1_CANDC|nr:copper transport protein, putative [Candida dubliniensis CD36]CAX41593.1 copper transport protein, putative [Candida dubliniensis CD36]